MIEQYLDAILTYLDSNGHYSNPYDPNYDHAPDGQLLKDAIKNSMSDKSVDDDKFDQLFYNALSILTTKKLMFDVSEEEDHKSRYIISKEGVVTLHSIPFVTERKRRDLELSTALQTEKLNNWAIKSRWWPHIISILSFVLAVLAFIISLSK